MAEIPSEPLEPQDAVALYVLVSQDNNAGQPTQVCTNCQTAITPLWRKIPDGQPLCNTCGLYDYIHGATRPPTKMEDIEMSNRRAQLFPLAPEGQPWFTKIRPMKGGTPADAVIGQPCKLSL